MLRGTGAYLACFVLHFLLIITISCRDIVWLVAHKLTILPPPFSAAAEKVEPIVAGTLKFGGERVGGECDQNTDQEQKGGCADPEGLEKPSGLLGPLRYYCL